MFKLRWSVLVALGAVGAAAGTVAIVLTRLDRGDSSTDILYAIRTLESGHDPKCHSTACRFEDFLYGTPLTEEAREAKIELQKELVRWLWVGASRAAALTDEDTVKAGQLQQLVAKLYTRTEAESGEIEVRFPNHPTLEISPVRARQYASIAYSLRGILSVQQDLLVNGSELFGRLDPEGLETLRDAADTVTLCALMIADQDARAQSQWHITGPGMRAAWRRLIPEFDAAAADRGREAVNLRRRAGDDPGRQGARILFDLIDNKIAAYQIYNEVDEEAEDVFLPNFVRFYAIYPISMERDDQRRFLAAYDAIVVDFTVDLLAKAQANAREAGHRLIRAVDANAAFQQLLPHEVDELEDVHFFVRLKDDKRVTVESYDCDSYRDLGRHWQYFKGALAEMPKASMPADPFAAEIVAEAVSQYGVVLARVAGRVAKDRRAARFLQIADLKTSQIMIENLAQGHHASSAPASRVRGIASVKGAREHESPSRFFFEGTDQTGISFTHRSSEWLSEFRRSEAAFPPTFSGGGIAAGDINDDSAPDLLLVGGHGNALLINDGRGRFTDITHSAGIGFRRPDGTPGEARQPIIADFDNDGRGDILITYANDDHRLYRNVDGHTFEDMTQSAGLGGRGLIGGPATVLDFDGDGLLDIYICYFGNYLEGGIPLANRDNSNALPNKLFRNIGGFRFADVTPGSGTADTGWAQAVSHTDFDRDGRQDLIVANDFGRNVFLRNLGQGRFENVAAELGVTNSNHSMNVGISDLNSDGYPDIYISNIATLVKDNKYVLPDAQTALNFDLRAMAGMLVKESNILYMSQADLGALGRYEPSGEIERGPTSTGWAWDAEFFDFDHDGDDDLYVLNGNNDYAYFFSFHTVKNTLGLKRHFYLSYARESNVFFVNEGGKLRNRSPQSGADFVGNSRSAAYVDLEGDGDLDIVVNNFHGEATVLFNRTEVRGRNWLKVRLIGDPTRHTNRDAIGARLVATTDGGLRVVREVQGGSGYLSMEPKEQHFGLGSADTVDLAIIWPNGANQVVRNLRANRAYTIHQGLPTAN